MQRFRAWVEQRFRSQPALAALAALARELGITPTQLNRVCHQVLGHSALGVLHGRLVLEALRDLAYTALAIKQIADGLEDCRRAGFYRCGLLHPLLSAPDRPYARRLARVDRPLTAR